MRPQALCVAAVMVLSLAVPVPMAAAAAAPSAPNDIWPALNAVACPAAGVCEVVGDDVALRTDSSGQTWAAQALPARTGDLSSVSCPTRDVCVAVGGDDVVRTTDSGHQWQRYAWAPRMAAVGVACRDAQYCVAVGRTDQGSSGRAWWTADGGATWSAARLPAGTGPLGDVACPSLGHCEAVGYANVLGTSDGGRQWYEQQLPFGVGEPAAVGCADVASCEVVGSQTALHTGNAGKTWALQKLPAPHRYPAGYNNMVGVSCPAPNWCQAVGNDDPSMLEVVGFVLGTGTAGASWHREYSVGGGGGFLDATACASESLCVAVGQLADGRGTVVVSRDEGQGWEPVPSG